MPALRPRKLGTITVLVVTALLLAGCGNSSTPQSVFKKFQTAAQAKDSGTMYDCMTVRGRDHIAGSLATLLGIRAQDRAKGAASKAILDKYKVSLETPSTMLVTPGQLGATIKDQRPFVIETVSFLAAAGQIPSAPVENAELTNLLVQGDVATGTTRKASGKTDKIAFRKVNGVWFIEMF